MSKAPWEDSMNGFVKVVTYVRKDSIKTLEYCHDDDYMITAEEFGTTVHGYIATKDIARILYPAEVETAGVVVATQRRTY